jgi:hypothetical protein
MRVLISRLRIAAAILAATLLGACTGGINAGEEGGVAFIAFTGMLILTIAILYYFLGRED